MLATLYLSVVSTTLHATAPDRLSQTIANLSRRLAWGDYDGDGVLGVFALDPSGRGRLYRNRGDGSFDDTTASLETAEPAEPRRSSRERSPRSGRLIRR
jgi:hypothetical protein